LVAGGSTEQKKIFVSRNKIIEAETRPLPATLIVVLLLK
jgi:hypothetical protein